MPAWGLAAATAFLVVAALVALPAALSQPQRSEAREPRPLPTMSAQERQPTAVFIGDSYTVGSGLPEADVLSERWSAVVSEQMGWDERNYGYGGTGYTTGGPKGGDVYADRIDSIVEEAPEVVVVSGGINDLDPSLYADAVNAFYDSLRARFPNADIIAVEPFWVADNYPTNLDDLATVVRDAVEAIDGQYVDEVGHVLVGHPEWVSDDALHPNAAGYAEIAEAVGVRVQSMLTE